MHLCLFEDLSVKHLQPLTYLNPVFELRSGCTTLREKLLTLFPRIPVTILTRAYLQNYAAELYPGMTSPSLPDDDILFINGRSLLDESVISIVKKHSHRDFVGMIDDEIAIAYVSRKHIPAVQNHLRDDEDVLGLFRRFPTVQLKGKMIRHSWDLVYSNSEEIEKDFRRINKKKVHSSQGKFYSGAYLLNKKNIIVGKGSIVKPGVVLDAEHGPIIVGNNVTIMPNSVIEGPVFIGNGSTIKAGAKIYPGTSIGVECKIGGEVTRSIIQSYSNKAHDGFLGDSYLGSWVNLGADTNTSNLKNTYGNVIVVVNGKPIDSGKQFVGLTMGDHSKSGINVMFNTGTVIGVSCNVFGEGMPPKYLPSFSWGNSGSYSIFTIEKSIEIAGRMMERRGLNPSKAYREVLRHVFTTTKKERKQWLKK